MKQLALLILASLVCSNISHSQGSQLQSIEDVISGIDSLLQEIDGASNSSINDNPSLPTENRPFRAENELMPKEFIKTAESDISPPEEDLTTISQPSGADAQPAVPSSRTVDFSKLTLSELLNEVDMLQTPVPGATSGTVEPLPVSSPDSTSMTSSLLMPSKEVFQPSNSVPIALQSPVLNSRENSSDSEEILIDDYIVLGDTIDQEMKEKIRECIMATRMASGGTNNPFVTRSVFKATSYCNRVLGRLNAPNHKRYRRDILLSMINMHEKNQAWVDAAKNYERFLEEFASNDNYPFEQHEDAPGIPDLSAPLGSVRKLLEGFKKGAPTIPETHIRLGKIYRQLGADRMALNKFYDAINATLTLPYNESFTDAEKRKGGSFESRKDAESNRAMLEIAETFLAGENYDSAIKFYDRLNRLEQLDDRDRSIVQYKRGLAHFRRAVSTMQQEENVARQGEGAQVISQEPDFDKTAC